MKPQFLSDEIQLDKTSTLCPICRTDLKVAITLSAGHVPPKFKGAGLGALKFCQRDHIQISASDQRVFIHVQTKNKHPHSTKKHK